MPKGIYKRKSIIERFWSKVDIKSKDECWNWKGALTGGGYGAFGFNGHMIGAHRVAWILTHGEIENDLHILHTCDNKPCCNPIHLWKGTGADNTHDMIVKGRKIQIKGSAVKNSKLTEDEVIEIRDKKKRGFTTTLLMSLYGVSRSEINMICSRQRWGHI